VRSRQANVAVAAAAAAAEQDGREMRGFKQPMSAVDGDGADVRISAPVGRLIVARSSEAAGNSECCSARAAGTVRRTEMPRV